jgi:hypothetical protein
VVQLSLRGSSSKAHLSVREQLEAILAHRGAIGRPDHERDRAKSKNGHHHGSRVSPALLNVWSCHSSWE